MFPAYSRLRSVAVLAGLAMLVGVVQPRLQSQMNSEPFGMPAKRALREANRRINLDRQKQMTENSAKLLQLATDLRAEVSTNNQRAISADAIRKAEQIAKLAHDVHEKMKLRFSE